MGGFRYLTRKERVLYNPPFAARVGYATDVQRIEELIKDLPEEVLAYKEKLDATFTEIQPDLEKFGTWAFDMSFLSRIDADRLSENGNLTMISRAEKAVQAQLAVQTKAISDMKKRILKDARGLEQRTQNAVGYDTEKLKKEGEALDELKRNLDKLMEVSDVDKKVALDQSVIDVIKFSRMYVTYTTKFRIKGVLGIATGFPPRSKTSKKVENCTYISNL